MIFYLLKKKLRHSFINNLLNTATTRIVILVIGVVGSAQQVVDIGLAIRFFDISFLFLVSLLTPSQVNFFKLKDVSILDISIKKMNTLMSVGFIFLVLASIFIQPYIKDLTQNLLWFLLHLLGLFHPRMFLLLTKS